MSVDENKAILQRADDCFARGDLTQLESLLAPDIVDHNPLPGQRPGREGFLDATRMFNAAFLDMRITPEVALAEGDLATVRWTAHATHSGELMGIPATGKPITITGTDTVRVRDGKIVEWWHNEDILGMMEQIGAVPAPAQVIAGE